MRQETIKSLLKRLPNYTVEVYSTNGASSTDTMHTDNINYIGEEDSVAPEQPILDWALMGEEDYTSTILANCSTTWAENAPDSGEQKILVILIEDVMSQDSIVGDFLSATHHSADKIIDNDSEILIIGSTVGELKDILLDQYGYDVDSISRHSIIRNVENVAVERNVPRNIYRSMSPTIKATEEGVDVIDALNYYGCSYVVDSIDEEISMIKESYYDDSEEIAKRSMAIIDLDKEKDKDTQFIYYDAREADYTLEDRHQYSFHVNGDCDIVMAVAITFNKR